MDSSARSLRWTSYIVPQTVKDRTTDDRQGPERVSVRACVHSSIIYHSYTQASLLSIGMPDGVPVDEDGHDI